MNFTFSADDGMGWMELVSSLVGTLTWPMVIVILVLNFKQPLSDLINSIEEAKWGENGVRVSRQLARAEKAGEKVLEIIESKPEAEAAAEQVAEAVALNPEQHEAGKTRYEQAVPESEARFLALLRISPAAAIFDAWIEVEQELRNVGYRHHIQSKPEFGSVHNLTKALMKAGILKPVVAEWINELRIARNTAAHAHNISVEAAFRFEDISRQVIPVLKSL